MKFIHEEKGKKNIETKAYKESPVKQDFAKSCSIRACSERLQEAEWVNDDFRSRQYF